MPVDGLANSRASSESRAHLEELEAQLKAKDQAIVVLALELSEVRGDRERFRLSQEHFARQLNLSDRECLRLEGKVAQLEKDLGVKTSECSDFADRSYRQGAMIERLENRLKRAPKPGRRRR